MKWEPHRAIVGPATIDSLRRPVTAEAVERPDNIRAATFDVRDPPYYMKATVQIPEPPDNATMRVSIAVDPVPMEFE